MSNMSLVNAAKQALPFKLTAAQERAFSQISDDLLAPAPMLRLLQVLPVRFRHLPGSTTGTLTDSA